MENTKIEWATHTFNPWVGCTKVSPGCDNCYAESWANRYGRVRWGKGQPRTLTSESNWQQPYKWDREAAANGKRARVFCASLADVFDNEVPDGWRYRLWDLIEATPNLDWLLLTKRVGNVKRMMKARWLDYPMPNVWLGISVVNQEEADRDIPKLLAVPAVCHFLSMEPLLGPVNISAYLGGLLGTPDKTGLNWVIVGGESGTDARPMVTFWVKWLRDQCAAAGTPFLFKQWGEWAPLQYIKVGDMQDGKSYSMTSAGDADDVMVRVGKKTAGRLLFGNTYDELPR